MDIENERTKCVFFINVFFDVFVISEGKNAMQTLLHKEDI